MNLILTSDVVEIAFVVIIGHVCVRRKRRAHTHTHTHTHVYARDRRDSAEVHNSGYTRVFLITVSEWRYIIIRVP